MDGNGSPASAAMAKSAAVPMTVPDDISVSCYNNEVPPFIEAELDRLYGNIFSSLAHFRTCGGLPGNTNTYVARKSHEIIAIFLFRCEHGRLQVINEGMKIDEGEIRRFAGYIFSEYKSVSTISFHAVHTGIRSLPFPYQCFNCTADIVLTLPGSAGEYLASLGKNTRRNIKRYMDKLKRSFPSFRYDFYTSETVDERQVRDIIGLNKARIAGKNKIYSIDNEVEQIIKLTKACGLVGVATIDDRVCGGAIGYLVGTSYLFKVIAHDPKYNDYSLGILCCYFTICECIARGCKQYNFMWNGYEYKFALGAVQRNLDHLVIYRSHAHFLLNAGMALRTAFNGYLHRIKCWLQDNAERQESLPFTARLVFHLANYLRSLKRFTSGLPARRK